MIKISRMADYAIVVLGVLGADRGARRSVANVAEATGLAAPTVAKILKQLASAGLVLSIRGADGGYYLSAAASAIAVSDVISAIDGPINLTACEGAAPHECGLIGRCGMRGRWAAVNRAVVEALGQVRLADMMERR